MNRCPSCGMPLPDDQEFCAPTKTMTKGGRGKPPHVKEIFLGCDVLDMAMLSSSTVNRQGPQTGKPVKHLTDYQRAVNAWGDDCILSEFGPLPTEGEIRAQPADHSAWAE